MAKKNQVSKSKPYERPFITELAVSGFKSIAFEQRIEVRPLTILAGANSSGKSSIWQPLLLLKQTMESGFDPGALLLTGPHVRFTLAKQLLSRVSGRNQSSEFRVGISISSGVALSSLFGIGSSGPLKLIETADLGPKGKPLLVRADRSAEKQFKEMDLRSLRGGPPDLPANVKLEIRRDKCFLRLAVVDGTNPEPGGAALFLISPSAGVERTIYETIHVPGWRGNPARAYEVSSVRLRYPGPFHRYTASVIAAWQHDDPASLAALTDDMLKLGLTGIVEAKQVDDARLEIEVGRLLRVPKGKRNDLVNIADVGFGVAQVLPILVALQVAEKGQLVIVEEPELHLHPRAQVALARIIAQAAKKGVRVILETHSALLLKGVQALVAEGKLDPKIVKLHWFQRDKLGSTQVTSADLDDVGRFGDWPEDFADVELKAESRYLDAAEAAHAKK